MTTQPSPDLLDLAEAVAAGTLRADDAERQLRLALGSDGAAESEQAVRELRGLIGATRAVRAHARATREAFSASPDLDATVAPTPASIATLIPGRITAGAVHRRSSNGGDGAGRGRGLTLLAAAALLLIGGAVAAGSGLVRLPSVVPPVPAPTLPVAVASPTAGPTISPAPTEAPVVARARAASWTATGSMVTPREGHTATLLPDGKVLVAGGLNRTSGNPNGTILASAELYDPSSGTWSATGNMGTARMSHTATLLADGMVLVAGGSGRSASLASAELYDPATGTWTTTGRMVTPRGSALATLLPDGKVLVAGGGTTSQDGVDTTTPCWTQPSCTTRPAGRGPPPGRWSVEAARPRSCPAARPRSCPTARCWWRAAPGPLGCPEAVATMQPSPSCTTRAAGPGAPPGTWSNGASPPRPRSCPTARCWWRAAATMPAVPPSSTTRPLGPGPPPGRWSRITGETRPRCCPMAR